MAKKELLKSLIIDVDKNIFEVNGKDVSDCVKALILEFENGEWSLMITEDVFYNTSDRTS